MSAAYLATESCPPKAPSSHRRRTLSPCANYYQLMRARAYYSPYMQTKSIVTITRIAIDEFDELTWKNEKNLASDPLGYVWRFSFMNEQSYTTCSRPRMPAGKQQIRSNTL